MNIKRYAIGLMVATLILGGGGVVSAQTATTTSVASLQALMQSLQEQIKNLTIQIENGKKAQQQIVSASGDINDTLKLIKQLREGMTGDDVKLLQAVLAADSTIYPEGLISGFYGKLTAQAVKRFQKKHDLDQVGNVGPKTLEKIAKELEKNPIVTEVRNGAKSLCAIVPPGHLIASGWLKKNTNALLVIPACQAIPAGIAKKLGLATSTPPTTTSDVTAPIISDLEIKDITTNSAKIEWETNESAIGTVQYGTANPLIISSAASVMQSAGLSKEHEFRLTGLASNTIYYVIVSVKDAAGNATTSSQRSFTTATGADVTAPIIAGLLATSTTATSSTIAWSTSEQATSKVWYGTTSPATANAPAALLTALATTHSAMATGLTTGTVYYYAVASTDAAGNTATSSEATFQTLSQ